MVDVDGESAAMARYAAGDAAAFGELYDALAPPVYQFLLARVRNRALAEDLVQQTFLHVHRARASFMTGSAVRPWIFAIARRLLIDSVRRRRLEERHLAIQENVEPSLGAAPDQELAAAQLADCVQETLERLPESQREAYVLTKQQGMSVADAAARLSTTVTAIKLRTHRAVEALRTALSRRDTS
jgi:RNA polymerase sigma-70 factor (ECF subfamily)